jgi:hypothetical protein
MRQQTQDRRPIQPDQDRVENIFSPDTTDLTKTTRQRLAYYDRLAAQVVGPIERGDSKIKVRRVSSYSGGSA